MSAARFTIPTIFTAVDKFSAPVKKMGASVSKFAAKAEKGVARAERGFRKLTPTLSGATKSFLSFASAAAIGAAIIGGIGFSVKALVNYEDALASTQAITGTTNEEFKAFEKQIQAVAATTKKSSVDVAKGFEIVGSAAPELLKNSEALAAVTEAAIILSKASGDELETSARSLTGVMNQFSLTGGAAAIRTMDVLANGSVVGSANITQVGESMKNFGAVAAGANLTLEESVALVEVMGKFSLFGAEAGTKLKGSVLKLQKAQFGYASGQFVVNDALKEAKAKFDALATAKEKDAFITKTFGAENQSTGSILLNNIGLFEEYTAGVNKSGTAVKQAEIKSNTLSGRLGELKAGWVNMITGSNGAGKALAGVKKAIVFVTDNMETIVSVGSKLLLFFGAFKLVLMLARGALMVYNVATKAVTAMQWLWNAAMMANPIGIMIAAAAAFVVGIIAVTKAMSAQTTAEQLNAEVKSRALDATLDQRVEVTMLFAALRKAKVGTDEYTTTLSKIEAMSPGIVQAYNLQAGGLNAINQAEKDLTASIMKRAEAEARAEMIKEKVKEALVAQNREASVQEKVDMLLGFTSKADFDKKRNLEAKSLFGESDILAKQQAASELEPDPLNPQLASSGALRKSLTESRETVTIDFKNMPAGVDVESSGGTNFTTPALGTTN